MKNEDIIFHNKIDKILKDIKGTTLGDKLISDLEKTYDSMPLADRKQMEKEYREWEKINRALSL